MLEVPAHLLQRPGVGQAVGVADLVGAGACECGPQAVRLLLVIFQLEVEFRLSLGIDGGLKRQVRIQAVVGERAVLHLGLHTRNLSLKRGYL